MGGGILAALFEALFGAFFKALFGARETAAARADLDQTHERAGAAEAANETQQTISDIADARANLPPGPATPADLARRMRDRARADRAAGRCG
jgi:hypothetical protein